MKSMEVSLNRRLELENQTLREFGVNLELEAMIVDRISVSRSAEMTVFMSGEQLYALVEVKNKAVLADINKMLGLSGLVPERFFEPANKPNYFYEMGLEQFKKVYPSRQLVSDQDLAFYKTLAPYNPALAQIRQIKNGRIKVYDADVKGHWRPYCKFYYNKIEVK